MSSVFPCAPGSFELQGLGGKKSVQPVLQNEPRGKSRCFEGAVLMSLNSSHEVTA